MFHFFLNFYLKSLLYIWVGVQWHKAFSTGQYDSVSATPCRTVVSGVVDHSREIVAMTDAHYRRDCNISSNQACHCFQTYHKRAQFPRPLSLHDVSVTVTFYDRPRVCILKTQNRPTGQSRQCQCCGAISLMHDLYIVSL